MRPFRCDSRVRRTTRGACCLALALGACAGKSSDAESALPTDLALRRPATSSSIENDEHDASHANDGEPETCWRADDEPEGGPDWWQVDLGKPFDLTACQITWPYVGMNYRYKVEGSADQAHWQPLSDQTRTASRDQVQHLTFDRARGVRYLRITIVGFDDGCCASVSEVSVFGSDVPHR
jgi:alpha-L-fucosidase